ncbi:HAD family hydrolase [Tundrisphaera lichenicola]|uniref:HAD family hydrolase n=1 Tax=Tundrisphaera lichenicola TaxID=2029860 RepID=UPI003EB926A8
MKLLVLDVEGTLFRTHIRLPGAHIDSTIWQAIAHRLGEDAIREEVATHDRWANGQYRSYLDWMRETIIIHQRYGLTAPAFRELIDAAEYNPNVIEALSSIDRSLYEPVMVSGGFRELAARAQRDLSIVHAFAACEYFFGNDGLLQTFNLLPCDFHGKIDFILLMLREYGLGKDDWVFIGDGANDVPIAKAAPVSIGYRPHPKLRDVVTHSIEDFAELLELLP